MRLSESKLRNGDDSRQISSSNTCVPYSDSMFNAPRRSNDTKFDTGQRGTKKTDMKLGILSKVNLTVLVIFTFSLYVLLYYFNFRIHDFLRLKQFIVGDERITNTTKKILFWNTMFGDENFYMGQTDIFHNCPVNDCYATHYKSFADVSEFEAILFHGNELDLSDLPTRRTSRQLYIFVNLESPANRKLISRFYEDYFNLTMTYSLNSDLMWTYGIVQDARTKQKVAPGRNVSWDAFYDRLGDQAVDDEDASLSKTIQGKTKPIVWFVSNCQAKSGRQEYVNELSRHIPVDVYGECGSKRCPLKDNCFTRVVEFDYFFYLSFENSLCDDYVTEKLYNALRYNVVPVVYGGANYSLFAPPKSYINVLDFDTPKDLAEYLKRLIDNPQEYKEYYKWKRYYKIGSGVGQVVCDLCEFLHTRKESQTRTSLSDWYSPSRCSLQEFLRYHSYITGSVLKRKD